MTFNFHFFLTIEQLLELSLENDIEINLDDEQDLCVYYNSKKLTFGNDTYLHVYNLCQYSTIDIPKKAINDYRFNNKTMIAELLTICANNNWETSVEFENGKLSIIVEEHNVFLTQLSQTEWGLTREFPKTLDLTELTYEQTADIVSLYNQFTNT